MELVLVLLVVFLAAGGWSWLGRRYLGARRFVADHPRTYKGAGTLSFLSSVALTAAMYVASRDDRRPAPVEALVAVGMIAALVFIPVWFVALLVAAFFYRNFVAPTLEIIAAILGGIVSVVRFFLRPFRTSARVAEDRQADAERVREAEEKRRAHERREAARARCEIFFSLHAPDIGSRFTRAMLDDYLRRFMGDNRTPEEVEERADALEAILQQHLAKARPAPRFTSLADIAAWFEEQKAQVDAMPDERLRQTLLAKLKARYAELTTQFLEEMQA